MNIQIIAQTFRAPPFNGSARRFLTYTLPTLQEQTAQKLHENVTMKCGNDHVVPVIGLEVHAQLKLRSKLFSQGVNSSQVAPNCQLDLLDISLPGVLPKLNAHALRAAVSTSFALNCEVQDVIHFDRKNYFYSDMPAGFQITQYNKPIAKDGYIDFIVTPYHNSHITHAHQYDLIKYLYGEDRKLEEKLQPYIKRSYIKQIQLEQDSAKTLHQVSSDDSGHELNDLVDYRRCGVGLMEIVFEPDLCNPHEASSLVKELIMILKALDTCDCEMQEGSLRVDANVSIRSIGEEEIDRQIAKRVELKNLNSLRALNRGIAYEIERQVSVIKEGDRVLQESRSYDSKSNRTILLREKEKAVDYRYVPEPSLPPLRIERDTVEEIRLTTESESLPSHIRQKLLQNYKLDLNLIVGLIEEPGLSEYFMEIMRDRSGVYNANSVAEFLIYAVANLKRINEAPFQVDLCDPNGDYMQRLYPRKLQGLLDMLHEDDISYGTAYEVMKCLFVSDPSQEPRKLIEEFGWFQVKDPEKIDVMCESLIKGMKNISKKYKNKGEKRSLHMMLAKLQELHGNKVSVKQAIYCLNKRLRPD